MPIYQISTEGEEAKRLVKATSAAAAIAHCARARFKAEIVTKVEDAAPLFAAGVVLEDAKAPAADGKPDGE